MTSPLSMAKSALECGLVDILVDRSGFDLSRASTPGDPSCYPLAIQRWKRRWCRWWWSAPGWRFAGDRRVRARRLGIADEGPGEARRRRRPGQPATQVEPAIAEARPSPSPSRAWKTAPVRGEGDGAGEAAVHRQHAGGDPDLLAPASPPSPPSTSARRRARGRGRRAGSRSGAPRRRLPAPTRVRTSEADGARRASRRSSAGGRRSGRSAVPRRARRRPSAR